MSKQNDLNESNINQIYLLYKEEFINYNIIIVKFSYIFEYLLLINR